LTYLRLALFSPVNLCVLAIATLFSLTAGVVLWLLWGVALEALALGALSRLPFFRRQIDLGIERAERLAMLRLMDEGHQKELAHLESLVSLTRENLKRQNRPQPDRRALDRLLATYVRLAIAHKSSREALAATDRNSLRYSRQALEALQASSERANGLRRRRLDIARRRAECIDRAQENLETLSHQLATIVEMVHLLHERSMTAVDAIEVESFMQDLEEHEAALRELDELGDAARLELKALVEGPPEREAI
jgi:hypothetical protein